MENPSIRQQIKRNFIAIVSLTIAVVSLGYTTWRNEHTEQNRNVRVAAFEILKVLGELQVIVDYAYFRKDQHLGDPTLGWGKVLFIKDLSQLVPAPVPEDIDRLLTTWRENAEKINIDNQSVQHISEDIYKTRRDVLDTLRRLY